MGAPKVVAGATDLTPYVPRLVLRWHAAAPEEAHRAVDGSLVFADVSGFTALSEKLARAGGKAGAEQMTDVINSLFDDLLRTAAARGGEMLKYGGDALLLFFSGEAHARRACAAAADMQQRIRTIGRVAAGSAGSVRLRMSVGVHSGAVDFFRVGRSHTELVVAGPAATECVAMEAAAEATEVLVSPAAAALLDPRNLGPEKAGGRLLKGTPVAGVIVPEPEPAHASAPLFVPAGLRSYLASGAVAPEHRVVTLAFLHLMGLDRELRVRGPAAATAALQDTMGAVQDAFDALGVTFLATDIAPDGTKVMAASGAPAAGEADEEIMLLALRRVVSAGTPLPVRAGVNRGHVFTGDVGPVFRRTYTCIGDVTNTAARVMGRARAGEVLALTSVLDHTRPGRFGVAQQEPFLAKGKTEPLVPYRVDGVVPEVAPGPVASDRPRLPYTGRERELELCRAEASRSHGALVELVGPVGSGKTRLVEETLAVVDEAVARLVVRCEPYERATPFFAVRQLLAPLVGSSVESLSEAVSQAAPRLAPWLPLLGAVVDVAIPDTEETSFLDARFRRQRTAMAVDELLLALWPERRVVVFEDVHWIDDASAEVLGQLGTGVARKPWLLFVTRRDEPTSYRSPADAVLVELEPLADEAVGSLISHAPGKPVPPHVREVLVRRAGGNPLFLTELLASRDGAVDEEVPDNLEAVIAAQIDSLPPADRRLVRCGAVLGSSFSVELLGQVAGEQLVATDGKALARRLRSIVVPEGRERLRFRHQLLRDVAYEALPYRERRDLHGRAAGAIEAALDGEGDERVGVLSLHALRAERYEACWRWARLAADRAVDRGAFFEAAELLERAVLAGRFVSPAAPALAEAWELLARASETVGLTKRAGEARRVARRLRRDQPAAFARLCMLESRWARTAKGAEAAVRWIRKGLAVLGEDPDDRVERANLLARLGELRLEQGRAREAIQVFQDVRALTETCQAPAARAFAFMGLDRAYTAIGQPQDGLADVALETIEAFEDATPAVRAVILQHAGAAAYYRGQWSRAVDLYARSRELSEKIGYLIQGTYGTLSIAEILVDQGRLEEAETELTGVARTFESLDFGLGLAYVTAYLGRIAVRRDDAASALRLLHQAKEQFALHQLGGDALAIDAWVAECLLRSGQVDEAAALALATLGQGDPAAPIAPMLHRVLAFAHVANGDIEGAWAELDESLRVAQGRDSAYDVALALEALAAVASLSGRAWSEPAGTSRRALLAELGVVRSPLPIPDPAA